jgi:hypothetical protein
MDFAAIRLILRQLFPPLRKEVSKKWGALYKALLSHYQLLTHIWTDPSSYMATNERVGQWRTMRVSEAN